MRGPSDARTFDAIVLAGGAARRLGGIDKPAVTVGGVSLLHRMIDAIDTTVGSQRIVVVGPHRDDLDPRILQTRESPPGSGPVAAIAAGLNALSDSADGGADVVFVAAADLPFVASASVRTVVAQLESTTVVFARDEDGEVQYLFGAWHVDALRRSLAATPSTENLPVRSIVPARPATVPVPDLDDCDTRTALDRARERHASRQERPPVPTVAEARNLVRTRIHPLLARSVAPVDALGATLREPVVAAQPLPPVDISAMDGYAVSGESPWTVRSDIAFAGTSGHRPLAPGDAVRIATGAHVPAGSTSVVRDEHVTRDGDVLQRRSDTPVRDDTRPVGEDWETGTPLVAAGTQVGPAVVSVALGSEVDRLVVAGPVRAHMVLSGNEIRRHGPLEPGQTRDTIGPVLPQYLALCGVEASTAVHLPDSPTAFEDLLAEPGSADIVVVVGATGGGAADQLRTALIRADADMIVRRTTVRPGGSQITAVLPSGVVVLGLPGNPLAAVATTMTIVPAIVDALTARTPRPPLLGRLTEDGYIDSPVDRVVPVRQDGVLWRVREGVRTAHLLDLVDQDALALIPAGVSPGAPVELLPLPR